MAIEQNELPTGSPPGKKRFTQRLNLILSKLDGVARRRQMQPEERKEFISWALLRMVESNYTVVRDWRGDARFRTYLNVVVSRLLLDFRDHQWGKFRVSKVARRAGRPAQLLDTFIHRDGFSTGEAVELVARNHRTHLDRESLRELADDLPERLSRQTFGLDESPLPSVPPRAEDGILRRERTALCLELQRELEDALADLRVDDLRILVLRFCRGCTADEIGADLDLDRRRVYQRIETILARLRRHLCCKGFQAGELLDLVGAEGVDMRLRPFESMALDAA